MTKLRFSFRVAGTLTDAASVVLAGPQDYGVMRTDTGEVLVGISPLVSMTRASAGVYEYTLALPESRIPISWYARASYNGSTYTFEQEGITGSTAEEPSSDYSTLSDLTAIAGRRSVATYADTNADSVPDDETTWFVGDRASRIQLAMDNGKAWIDSHLRRYAAQGVPSPVPNTHPDFALVRQATAHRSLAYLYAARGARDTMIDPATGVYDPSRNKANLWLKIAGDLLKQFVDGIANDFAPNTFQSVDIVRDDGPERVQAWNERW